MYTSSIMCHLTRMSNMSNVIFAIIYSPEISIVIPFQISSVQCVLYTIIQCIKIIRKYTYNTNLILFDKITKLGNLNETEKSIKCIIHTKVIYYVLCIQWKAGRNEDYLMQCTVRSSLVSIHHPATELTPPPEPQYGRDRRAALLSHED